MVSKNTRAFWFLIPLLLLPKSGFTFQFSPMSVALEPLGKGASTSFTINNKGAEKIAVQITMAKREVDEKGVETQPEADDDFIVYPPQLILAANEQRTIRLTWAGNPKPEKELSYRIIAEQLPVDVEQGKKKRGAAVVNVLVKYVGAVYITPKGAKPALAIPVAQLIEKPKPQLKITFANTGSEHILLNNLRLHLSSKAKPADTKNEPLHLGPAELKNINGENILSGGRRTFFLPWPAKLPKGPVTVDFDFKG